MTKPGCYLQAANTADVFLCLELFYRDSAQKEIPDLSREEIPVGGKWLSAHSLIEAGI